MPKDTDMIYDKSADLQSPTMCGNTYVYESSGTDTDRAEPGSTGESQVGKRGYAGMRETRMVDNEDDLYAGNVVEPADEES